jgi:hypothetical protein
VGNGTFLHWHEASEYPKLPPSAKDAFRKFLGKPLERSRLAAQYAGKSPERILHINKDWPPLWKAFLGELVKRDPLSAKFGEAWVQQKDKQELMHRQSFNPLPWESTSKKWWRKERNELALAQIANAATQRMIWAGDGDVLELSGGNTLAFITICKHIWQAWMRTEDFGVISDADSVLIPVQVQASGIYDASRMWVEKISPQRYNGDTRAKVVLTLANWFRKTLVEDTKMSNPGNNGFSITREDLSHHPELEKLLNLCCDFGDLVSRPHTTKLADQKPRNKWYLAPLSSPYFRIPHVHTKEPIYSTAPQIIELLSNALSTGTWGMALNVPSKKVVKDAANQMSFPFKNDEQ